jgi:hypothetical protein
MATFSYCVRLARTLLASRMIPLRSSCSNQSAEPSSLPVKLTPDLWRERTGPALIFVVPLCRPTNVLGKEVPPVPDRRICRTSLYVALRVGNHAVSTPSFRTSPIFLSHPKTSILAVASQNIDTRILNPEHPTIDVLKLYSLDHLNLGEKARLETHFSTCAECRRRVSSLAGTTESTAVAQCRQLFLKAAAHHPEIRLADSLRAKVFTPTQKLWRKLGLPVPNLPSSQWTPAERTAKESWNRQHIKLLHEWAGNLNLQYDWVISEAAGQLSNWGSFPESKDAFTGIVGYQAPSFYIEPWHVDHEREIPYRKRMKEKFTAALEAHIREVKRLRSDLLPDRGSRDAHYLWAAERVCLGRKWNDIASQYPVQVSWQAVRNAVQPILKKIGVLPTQPKQGKKDAF